MKITEVEVTIHERSMPSVIGLPDRMPLGVLSIRTDEGLTGHNFLGPNPDAAQQVMRVAKPMLIGRNPLDVGAIWHELWERSRVFDSISIATIGAVDVALWDLAGQAAGLPVHRLLGTCRDQVPAYASSWVLADSAAYVDEAVAYQERGLHGYKLHPPTQRRRFAAESVDIAADIDACSAVRAAVGDAFTLMLDSAWAYDYREALDVGFAIQDLGFYWYEDPLAADDLDGYVRLKQQLHIPLLATELTAGGLYSLAPWVVARATDFLRGDVILKGGVTGLVKIAHLAEAFHLNCEVHDGFNALNNVAGIHVIMAIRNCEFFELITIHEPGDHGFEHLSYGLTEPIEIDDRGFVHAPTEPGLGYEIDWDLINRSKVAELS